MGCRPHNTSEEVTVSSTAKHAVSCVFALLGWRPQEWSIRAFVFFGLLVPPYFPVGNPYSPVSRQHQYFGVYPSTAIGLRQSDGGIHINASQYFCDV